MRAKLLEKEVIFDSETMDMLIFAVTNSFRKFWIVRWNATRTLLSLYRNSENYGVINHQVVTLIDSNGVYIKNLIMRHLHKINGITDKTKEYIVSKCKHDANFVVRMVCAEEEQKRIGEE